MAMRTEGFTLIEIAIALFIMTFGLLAAGQMLFIATASSSLSRSIGTAAVAAQSRIEALADLYRRDPSAADLAPGDHGPVETAIPNQNNGTILNRYEITWNVSSVPDPRPGRLLDAKIVRVTIVPILSGGGRNLKPRLNNMFNLVTILNPVTQ